MLFHNTYSLQKDLLLKLDHRMDVLVTSFRGCQLLDDKNAALTCYVFYKFK